MVRVLLLFLGAIATISFASLVLIIYPSIFILPSGHTEVAPYSSEELKGREVYIKNGCIYCHSQQVRDPAITVDSARGWGRPSYPSDYAYDMPALLGTMRTGPDLLNVGARLPDRRWHFIHLFQPRAVAPWSIMPAFPFLFEEKSEAQPGDEVVPVPAPYVRSGSIVVASEEAKVLVSYLLSLRREVSPKELEQGGQ